MAQKGRQSQNNHGPQSTGGNVLFFLGMVSVVALLIIGYVLTQGGVDNIKDKVDTVINLKPTQAPVPQPVATPVPATVVNNDDVTKEYELKLKKQSEEFAAQLDQQKRTYETQLSDLKMQIQILKDENKRLRGGS